MFSLDFSGSLSQVDDNPVVPCRTRSRGPIIRCETGGPGLSYPPAPLSIVSLSGRVGEFMKAYSLIIVMYIMYSGIVELSSERTHGSSEILIWVLLAVVGVYGILTFVIVEGIEY